MFYVELALVCSHLSSLNYLRIRANVPRHYWPAANKRYRLAIHKRDTIVRNPSPISVSDLVSPLIYTRLPTAPRYARRRKPPIVNYNRFHADSTVFRAFEPRVQ